MASVSQSCLAYITFDVVPSPKGAAVHVESFVQALASTGGQVDLVTVSPKTVINPLPNKATAMNAITPALTSFPTSASGPLALQYHPKSSAPFSETLNLPGLTHTVLPAVGRTLIDRVLVFRHHLQQWLQDKQFEVIQLRSIFEGYPIAQAKSQYCRWLIFEVNGLPSIELKYRYPKVADDSELMHKLLAQEQFCLEIADEIITPSRVTRNYLIGRGISATKIQVIPNGVDLSIFTYQPPRAEPILDLFTLLYSGTLSTWQGIDLALEALALYRRDFEAKLMIVGPARGNQLKRLKKQARRLGVEDHITYVDPVPQSTLAQLMQQADAIVAPLKANDRNCVQGCCPLKVIEGMASGTPVITSDLPVVTDLGETEQHFFAVRPGSAKAIKDALLRLRQHPELRLQLSRMGRSHVEKNYTWHKAQASLLQRYEQMIQSQ